MKYYISTLLAIVLLTGFLIDRSDATALEVIPEKNYSDRSKTANDPGLSSVIADLTIAKTVLRDKIKGGWAGQTIGVTFGGPTEFKFNGTFIPEYQPIQWNDGYIRKTMNEWPDLYDDIYMDLTFVDVLEKHGLDAPTDSFANAFAYADYNLWHANQGARFNILNGIKAPESGHWTNNPHADDIDFQIEADFAGLMSPGMPDAASKIGDKIGHIMNYGDGWYGGIYVSAMYTLAFTSNDIQKIVRDGLKAIPSNSQFYRCIADVIRWHAQYPNDWHRTWFELQKKWSDDVGCPEGVYTPLNIDAKINAAYVVVGLLYGNGDFEKTLEISTRCGQDSDCNPSTAAGILGTVLGYEKIPVYWQNGLALAEDIKFKYTTMSLNKVYEISYKHALDMIRRNGGSVNGDNVIIRTRQPTAVAFEQGFSNMYPQSKLLYPGNITKEISFDFEGTGFALRGAAIKKRNELAGYEFEATLYLDGTKVEEIKLPTSFITRRYELFWKYGLANTRHNVRIALKNPNPDYELRTWDYVTYSDKPFTASYSKKK